MRFFTLLPALPKKSQLISLSKKSPFYMPSPAWPMGQSLLKIGIGLSGVVNVLCPSAIAAPLPIPKRPLSDPVSQTLSTDSPNIRPLLLEPASSHSDILNVQPLPPLADSTLDLTSAQPPAQQPKVNPKQPTTQICQSLQICDRAFTIEIDAAGATALGDLAEAPSALKTDISEIETEAIETKTTEAKPAVEGPPEAPLILNASVERSAAVAPLLSQRVNPEPRYEPKETERTGSLDDLIRAIPRRNAQPRLDDELGTIRASPLRSRGDEDLGILRLLQKAAAPPRPKTPSAFLTGRLGYFNSENAFRLDSRENEQIYQSGLSFAAFPALSENTSLYAIAETNLGRFEQAGDRGYNEIELQLGVRQKLLPRTYAQIGVRNQRFYSFGYERQILGINYIDTVVSHRSIFNSRTWLDSFYQARLGFADTKRSSRFRQTLTLSLNYAVNKDLRTSLLYQLDLEDYTQISRYDVYQQVIGTVSYRLTPESQISVFGGTRFGNSASSDPALSSINLDDTFYGAGLTVNLPLF